MRAWGKSEWEIEDRFGRKWRLRLPSFDRPSPDPDPEDIRTGSAAILALVRLSVTHAGPTDARVLPVMLSVYDALFGDNLADTYRRGDPQRRLRESMGGMLLDRLQAAVRFGRLIVEHVPQAPWPFLDTQDVPELPDAGPAREDTHFIELLIVNARGEGVGGIACQVTLPDGTMRQGTSGPDGILHLRDLDGAGVATVVLPDVRPFPPAEARGGAHLRIVEEGVSADTDDRTTIEIPPQVYRGRLIGMFFDSSKSFLLPQAMRGIRSLTAYFERRRASELLVVGHTDTTGSPEYNVGLSLERADAVVAFLREDVDAWLAWFDDQKTQEKRWGTREVQLILSALPDDGTETFYVGAPTGRNDRRTRDGLARFQGWSNETRGTALTTEGTLDDATRAELVRAYMALEGTSIADELVVKTHGCGEFHPLEDLGDGVSNPDNRRVEIFVFEDAITPTPRACKKPGCTEYEAWLDRVIETQDFRTGPFEPAPLVAGRLPTLYTRGSSFPKPSAIPMLREAQRRMAADGDVHALIIGHTDRGAGDSQDATLAQERADLLAAWLVGDDDPFLQKFERSDGEAAWGWEEIQWMLSAVLVDDEPCYAGVVDGHRGTATVAAIERFQIFHELTISRALDQATLLRLVAEYLARIGTAPVGRERVVALSGGSWHAPGSFGPRSTMLQGAEFESNTLPSFRRAEIFLSLEMLSPPESACTLDRHEACSAYSAWCRGATETLPLDDLHEVWVRIEDAISSAIAGCALTILNDEGQTVASASTSDTGMARLRAPRGTYTLAFTALGRQQRASFILDQDQFGAVTVSLSAPDPLLDGERPASAT